MLGAESLTLFEVASVSGLVHTVESTPARKSGCSQRRGMVWTELTLKGFHLNSDNIKSSFMTVDIALQKNNDQQVFEEEGVRRARHIPTFLCLCSDIKTSCLPELFRFSELKKFVRILFIFWRGQWKERERERTLVCERNIDQLPLRARPGPQPTPVPCLGIGLSVHRPALNPRSHTCQGSTF